MGDASVVRAPLRARVSWMLFDWSVQPHYTLVTTFLFAPYFANFVAGNPADGQAYWGYAAALAGAIIAVGSPFLGALADGRGQRKPWMLFFSAIFVGALALLWFAQPNAPTHLILVSLLGFIVATMAAEFMAVFSNAIMTGLVPKDELGRLSGTGWAVGYFGGLFSLAIMAGLIVPVPETGKTLLGLEPLLALDTATREGDRIVGPFSAIWFLIFIIPFFLFVPDPKPAARAAGEKTALAELWDTISSLPSHRSMLLFLIARMLYTDGLTAIFTFGGIYGAAVFGWGALELGIFGIVLTLTGALGAIAGGWLDDKLGARTVIVGALLALIIGAIGILSVDRDHILFVTNVAPKAAGSSPFSSPGEITFLLFAVLVGVVSAPVGASSRSLMARLAPADKITQFFGLFAFSGKVTAFMAPLLVALVTQISQSQRIGMASILTFLIIGIVLMLFVREDRRAA